MSDILSWPALSLDKAPLPSKILCEHGIWGKVPGARTDFRWIASSSGLEREELERHVSLGAEDKPKAAQLWRSVDDRCIAVGLYPSPAVDADGRRDFLEKQVLAWRRPAELPAALGALLLLPHVETLTAEIWWDHRGDRAWENPAFSLRIPGAELPVDLEQLDTVVRQGVTELRDALDKPGSLKRLYAQILGGRRPAWLTGLERPLSARALAVLLLPLPRNLSDPLSLAGWIPSGRVSFEDLAGRWNALVLPPHLKESIEIEDVHPDAEAGGWAFAQGLLDLNLDLVLPAAAGYAAGAPPPMPEPRARSTEPPVLTISPLAALRPRTEIPLPPPPAGASALLRELHAFAQAVDRRWLDPGRLAADEDIGPITRLEPIPEQLFPSWIETLQQRRPNPADAEQWTVKLDLLRSAALVLRPAPDTFQRVGLPESRRVPALFFALLLGKRDLLTEMGIEALSEIVRQSLSCLPDPRARQVRDWIAQWPTKKPWLRSLIAEAVKAQ